MAGNPSFSTPTYFRINKTVFLQRLMVIVRQGFYPCENQFMQVKGRENKGRRHSRQWKIRMKHFKSEWNKNLCGYPPIYS
jgi:hypothetical protein